MFDCINTQFNWFRLDKGKTGFVKLDAIYKRIHWTRSLITDCILEILDIEHGIANSLLTINSECECLQREKSIFLNF